MARKGWYEREEVPTINHDWVSMHCKNITNREMKLLRIINDRRLVRRDHLEIIHEDFRNAGDRRTSILNRSIKKLFEKMCIDKVHEEAEYRNGNKPAVLSLDRAGAILLGLDKRFKRRIQHNDVRIIDTKKFIFRELPNNFPHVHGINELEVKTILLGDELGFDIVRWDLEEKNTKMYMYNQRYILKPDIFTILRVNKKPFMAFIEYDTGKEDNRNKDKFPVIREKLEKYHYYKLCGSWKRESWAEILPFFPILLFVTEDKKRIPYINDKGQKMGLKVKAIHSSEYQETLKDLVKALQ
jgi:hypothetical protein